MNQAKLDQANTLNAPVSMDGHTLRVVRHVWLGQPGNLLSIPVHVVTVKFSKVV